MGRGGVGGGGGGSSLVLEGWSDWYPVDYEMIAVNRHLWRALTGDGVNRWRALPPGGDR